jgi:hypothetical protein
LHDFWGIQAVEMNGETVSNNRIGWAAYGFSLANIATGTNVMMLNNTWPDGSPVVELDWFAH